MRVYKPSGIEWLGEIPQSWEIKKCKFFFTIQNTIVGDLWNKTKLLSLTLNGVVERDINNPEGKFPSDFSTYQLVKRGNLVFCLFDVEETPRAIGLSQIDGMITSAYTVIKVVNQNERFLAYLFISLDNGKNLSFLYRGLRKTISKEDLLNLKIPLPPLQEQKEIAEFLDSKCEKIQNYIDKKQKLITLLQEKKQALINEAVCGRVACHTERSEVSTTAYKPSGIEYLGLIPHHWEAVKVKFTAYVKGRIGFHGLNSNEFRYDEGAYLVTGNDFDNNEVMWDKCRRVSEERFYEDPNIHLQNNDLLITKDGTIGKTAIVNNCPKQATLNSGIFLVRTLKEMCFVKYLFFIINSQYFKEFVNVKTSGSTIKHLYQSDFHDLKIPLPPLQEQKEIAAFLDSKVAQIDSAIEKTKKQIELIKEYKNTLINEAVCGRINLKRK
ncbi:restriction endonuclease subunit S [Campylobacter helveticus]|uniref:restriction endonuclease subunit S n=1 Tax=Campylobacter helveticus TaxID=28898 RepID=UPI00111265A7|nr:restriction endonuclease subunit S [Campylobacter helveticus]TNB56923.1 restriction endonuclease subunit S [Campylobacter helveticus]